MKVKSLSRARLLATPWTAAYQAPPSMGFSRQEYWSGLPLPSYMLLEETKIEAIKMWEAKVMDNILTILPTFSDKTSSVSESN